jgi:hypothetical protein
LTPEDEICRANHYWIYLDERDEVKSQLGIEMPKHKRKKGGRDEDEITETQTERIDPSAVGAILTEEKNRKDEEHEAYEEYRTSHDGLPELSEIDQLSEQTAVMTNRALREYRPAAKSGGLGKPVIHVMGDSVPRPGMERPLFWRVVMLILVIMAGLLIGWTLSVLQTRQ